MTAAALFSVLVGTRTVPLNVFLDKLTGHRHEGIEADIIDARIVRTLWGLTVGAAFGLAGAGMQGVTRNPLGDPGILGVNAGAAFAVFTGITFFGITSTPFTPRSHLLELPPPPPSSAPSSYWWPTRAHHHIPTRGAGGRYNHRGWRARLNLPDSHQKSVSLS